MLDLVEQRRRTRRGHAPRRDRAARPRPGRLPTRATRALVYGRMTGWGQDGPWSQAAGPRHELHRHHRRPPRPRPGRARPHFPGNLLGDFGGGSTYLVIGVLAALLEAQAQRAGPGRRRRDRRRHRPSQRDGVDLRRPRHGHRRQRRSGLLDGGTPYYDIYETADGKHMSVGALEPQFYAALVARLGARAARPQRPGQLRRHPRRRSRARFKEKTQAEWSAIFDGTDACVAAIIPLSEAYAHPHLAARGDVRRERRRHPARAGAALLAHRRPRSAMPPGGPGAHTRDALTAWGVADVDALIDGGAPYRRDHAPLPLPRHPRRGRRRPAGVRRRAGRHRPAARRAGAGPARGRPARRGRPRRLVRDHPRRRTLQRVRPRRPQVAGPAPGRGRAARPRRDAWSLRTSRSSAPATASGCSASWPAGVVDRTYGEPIGALPVRLTADGGDGPALRRVARGLHAPTSATRRRSRGCPRARCCSPRPTPARSTRSGSVATSTPRSSTPSSTRSRSATGSTPTAPTATTQPHERESLKAAAREALVDRAGPAAGALRRAVRPYLT